MSSSATRIMLRPCRTIPFVLARTPYLVIRPNQAAADTAVVYRVHIYVVGNVQRGLTPLFPTEHAFFFVVSLLCLPRTYDTHTQDDQTMRRRCALVGRGKALFLLASRTCLLYTSPSPRDLSTSRMPSSA